ncbi:ABC transporter permease subunit [Lagierella sp.]|uniref:ABC transporter permease n=1 Tax=Lagierella sp. TaxID=2849657 RepID=UPI00262B8110|nr:ABC transporter permease subunit [Lagierella sp.]
MEEKINNDEQRGTFESLTQEDLEELEKRPKTKSEMILDRIIIFLPFLMAMAAFVEYIYWPHDPRRVATALYSYFILIQAGIMLIFAVVSLFNKNVFRKFRYKAPFYTVVYLIFMVYDILTLKTGKLMLPYFPWVDQVLNSAWGDRAYLWECIYNSVYLLLKGYFIGAILGIITGLFCGYFKSVRYWISPFMKLLGAIPSMTWLPIIMVLASTLHRAAVFVIALGVWFALTTATMTGIRTIDTRLFDAAKTLGASQKNLILNVAVPSAMPNIFSGLVQGMSTACTALLVAEMVGVESGLGWYITWQKSWANFDKMYAAIVIICLVFLTVNFVLNTIQRKVLKWKEQI